MSLYRAREPSRNAPGNEWPEDDVVWVKMLYLNWMEPKEIADPYHRTRALNQAHFAVCTISGM